MSSTTAGFTALQIVMRAADISQADLARELECSRAWVNDVVHGRVTPSPRFIQMAPIVLAGPLEVDPAELRSLLWPELEGMV